MDGFRESLPGEVHVTSKWKQTLTVVGQEQGSHALNFPQAGFERAAQECERSACDEVHVALAACLSVSAVPDFLQNLEIPGHLDKAIMSR